MQSNLDMQSKNVKKLILEFLDKKSLLNVRQINKHYKSLAESELDKKGLQISFFNNQLTLENKTWHALPSHILNKDNVYPNVTSDSVNNELIAAALKNAEHFKIFKTRTDAQDYVNDKFGKKFNVPFIELQITKEIEKEKRLEIKKYLTKENKEINFIEIKPKFCFFKSASITTQAIVLSDFWTKIKYDENSEVNKKNTNGCIIS